MLRFRKGNSDETKNGGTSLLNRRNSKKSILLAIAAFFVLVAGFMFWINNGDEEKKVSSATSQTKEKPTSKQQEPTAPTNAEPKIQLTDIQMLINKEHGLSKDYVPPDLTVPDVKFVYQTKEIRQMRKEAADALEEMFAAAKKDGLPLAAVSGYRSYQTQKILYESYVKRNGQKEADRFSSRPGHSEHMTGLAMDISGYDGKCAASRCFHGSKEAKWLENNAYKFGFILRYPPGKEEITGYMYESWHYRYVGKPLAKFIHEKGITLEEYYRDYVKK